MRNKRNKRSRRLGTPSPDRRLSETQVETLDPENATLTNFNVNVHESLGENNSENQLAEPSQFSNEIQVWTQIMEQKNDDKIEKIREEMAKKFEAISKEVKSNKTASTVTNPRSELNVMQNRQFLGSEKVQSIEIHASNNENSAFESNNYPLRASKMKDLKQPVKPLFQNESDVDATILSNEESDEEDYHMDNELFSCLTFLLFNTRSLQKLTKNCNKKTK